MQAQTEEKPKLPNPLAALIQEAAKLAVQAVNLDKDNQLASAIPLYLLAARGAIEATILLKNGPGRLDLAKKAGDYLNRAKYLIGKYVEKKSEGIHEVVPLNNSP